MITKTDEILRLKGLIQDLVSEEKQLLKLQEQFGNTSFVKSQIQHIGQLNKEIRITSLELTGISNKSKSVSFSNILGDLNSLTAVASRVFGAISIGFNAVTSAIMPVLNAVKEFGIESFNAFNKSEVSLNRLKFGLEGINDIGSFDNLINQSKELQKISIFSDESINNSMAMLTSLKMNASQIEQTIPSILDLASAYTQATGDTDGLNTITRLLSSTADDELYKALNKVGVVLDDAQKKQLEMASGSQRVTMIMGMVGDKFNGISQTLSGTTLGGMQQLTNMWNDLQVAVGGVISQALLPVIELLKELWPVIQEGISSLASFAEEWVTTMIEAAGGKAEFADLKTVLMELIKEGFNKIIEVGHELMPTFKELYTAIGELIGENTNFIDVLKLVAAALVDLIAEFVKWIAKIQTTAIEFINFIKNINNAIDRLVKSVFGWFSKALPTNWIDEIANIIGSIKNKIQEFVTEYSDNPIFKLFRNLYPGGGHSGGDTENEKRRLADNYINSDTKEKLTGKHNENNKAESGNKLRLEQEQELTRLDAERFQFAQGMWSNFQGMLQATGLMKGQFGEIINFINSFLNSISSGVSFVDSLIGFFSSFIPGGGLIAGAAKGTPGMGGMPNIGGLSSYNTYQTLNAARSSSPSRLNQASVNISGELRLKGKDAVYVYDRNKAIQTSLIN